MPRRPLQNMLLLVSLMAVEAVADQWIESGLYVLMAPPRLWCISSRLQPKMGASCGSSS